MELENERMEQINAVLQRYGISSLDDAKELCEKSGIDIIKIIKEHNKEVPEIAICAYTLGTAIALKKDTKLASYAAMDIGEGIQAFCAPETDAYENRAGLGHGYQASMYLKNHEQKEEDATNYGEMLSFLELSNDELLSITSAIAKAIEEKVAG